MKWWSADGSAITTEWVWGDKTDLLMADVGDATDDKSTGSTLSITRGPNSYGCI